MNSPTIRSTTSEHLSNRSAPAEKQPFSRHESVRGPSARVQRPCASRSAQRGDARRIAVEEPPRLVSPRSRVIDADARRAIYFSALGSRWCLDPQRPAAEVFAREPSIYVHRSTNQTRTPGLVPDIAHGFDGADQHRVRNALFARDDVEAIPHAINQIDVGVTGRAEHHSRAFGPSARRSARPDPADPDTPRSRQCDLSVACRDANERDACR